MILATIIRILHIMLIFFILFAPFSNIAPILILNITCTWCLLVHWAANNDICFLTLMEAKLRGIDYRKGFLHQFVAPVYNISDKQMSQYAHGVVVSSLLISVYNLLEHKTFSQAVQCYKKGQPIQECLKVLFKQ